MFGLRGFRLNLKMEVLSDGATAQGEAVGAMLYGIPGDFSLQSALVLQKIWVVLGRMGPLCVALTSTQARSTKIIL